MNKVMALAALAAAILAPTITAAQLMPKEERPPVPNLGLMLNDDGDFTNTLTDVPSSVQNLRIMLRTMENTGIKTVMYSIGTGSDILFYESDYGSVWGWREVSGLTSAQEQRLAAEIAVREAGVDPLMIVAEETEDMGMYFFPTYRMNDAHYGVNPTTNWLTGEFWMENQDKTLGESPIPGVATYAPLLDFVHPEVYDYRQGIVFEAMERYQEVMEGFELDFGRTPFLFAPGTQQDNKEIMTDFVRDAREKLDVLGVDNDRYYTLVVRVPTTMANCHWAGMEVDKWIEERLVDVVMPSQIMTSSYDMPIDDFLEAADGTGVVIYIGAMQRINYTWPFGRIPPGNLVNTGPSRAINLPLVAGMSNYYRSIGVENFQLYNFNLLVPPVVGYAEIYGELANPNPYETRAYGITPAYFRDDLDTYEYKKQIPVRLNSNLPTVLRFPVGETFDGNPHLDYLALRVGLRNATLGPDTRVRMALNGNVVLNLADPSTFISIPTSLRGQSTIRGFIQVEVDPAIVNEGENVLTLTYFQGDGEDSWIDVEDLILGAEFEEPEDSRLSTWSIY